MRGLPARLGREWSEGGSQPIRVFGSAKRVRTPARRVGDPAYICRPGALTEIGGRTFLRHECRAPWAAGRAVLTPQRDEKAREMGLSERIRRRDVSAA